MSDFKEKERLEDLRGRLYERGQEASFRSVRHDIVGKETVDVARGWAGMASPATPPVVTEAVEVKETPVFSPAEVVAAPTTFRRRYRTIVLLSSLALFVVAIVASSLYVLFGGNQISGKNIDIALSGPLATPGGEVMAFTATITNKNTVAIESATLIINYPPGTRSVGDNPRDMYEERLPLEQINPGETKTVPLQAVVFGEENEAKEVKAALDYRVTGSNSLLFKESAPMAFTINSSPLVLRIESVEKISSGQEFEVKFVVESNASTPLQNVLINAEYPEQFRFVRSEPTTSFGNNAWLIEDLDAKGKSTIKVRGSAAGLTTESFVFRVTAGTPRSDNQFMVGSMLAQTSATVSVEQPFIGVKLLIAGDGDGDVVLSSGENADVSVRVTNTHTQPIYDMRVQVVPSGSAFDERSLRISDGFYDSVNKDVRWEVSGSPDLATVRPGSERAFNFSFVTPDDSRAANLGITANVYGRRVNEVGVAEELVGVAKTTIRYSSTAAIGRQLGHLAGPVPPVVNKETIYTVSLIATAGANDISGAVLTTSLPQYVRWLNTYTGPGTVTFNPISKELRWQIGEMKGGARSTLDVQVGLTPSLLQVGDVPVMLNQQSFEGTDRFTGSVLRTTGTPLTTELSEEIGFGERNGEVREVSE